MNSLAAEAPPWSRRRWWAALLGLFILQVLLLCWFGARGSVKPRQITAAPRLAIAGETITPLLALTDPTLFAQGHPQGFSGGAWMGISAPPYQPPEWSESPRWLNLDLQQLGADFRRFILTNPPFAFASAGQFEPEFAAPEIAIAPRSPAPSAWRLEGALATRAWLNPPQLPAWANSDLLTNTVVQVLVNRDGQVHSEVLLGRSGLDQADAAAMVLARTAQFEPSPRANREGVEAAALTRGALIFEWQTLPLPPTNAAPASP